MGNGYRQLDFHQITLKREEIEALPKPVASLILALTVAVNDITVHQRLLVQLGHNKISHSVAQEFVVANYLVIFRTLMAKIVECVHLLRSSAVSIRRLKDSKNDKLARRLKVSAWMLTRGEGYATAKRIRDHSTNHYIAQELIKSVENYPKNHEFSFYMHDRMGNSLAPFAEEIATLGIMTLNGVSNSDLIYDWAVRSSGFVAKTHGKVLATVLNTYLPRRPHLRRILVESRLIGSGSDLIPIFLE